ncbi:MAG: response regulator [Streptococcus sp.]|nr:response regulator [Streptococcus sp.]
MFSLLIVEDEYIVRQGISSLVDFDYFQINLVQDAENGKEAWEYCQKQDFDIVLADINMPFLNGIELAKLIKEKSPQTHIVFITGYDNFDYALQALKLGADDYLLKPFSKTDIEKTLENIIYKLRFEQNQGVLDTLITKTKETELKNNILSHLSESDFSLKKLARELNFNSSYLSQLVKKEIGTSFQDYLIQERMKKAKLLLMTTDLKIYEIAEAVGFEDFNYFSQRFKQITGLTPREFKKKHKQ